MVLGSCSAVAAGSPFAAADGAALGVAGHSITVVWAESRTTPCVLTGGGYPADGMLEPFHRLLLGLTYLVHSLVEPNGRFRCLVAHCLTRQLS